METTAEADTEPGADRVSCSSPGGMRVKGVSREPDEATEARVLEL